MLSTVITSQQACQGYLFPISACQSHPEVGRPAYVICHMHGIIDRGSHGKCQLSLDFTFLSLTNQLENSLFIISPINWRPHFLYLLQLIEDPTFYTFSNQLETPLSIDSPIDWRPNFFKPSPIDWKPYSHTGFDRVPYSSQGCKKQGIHYPG